MALASEVIAELSHRIRVDVEHFGGTMQERTALAWRGYLAAMLEWELISIAQYDDLLAKIPDVADVPAIAILRGRD
jgi:hypothetical protein